MATPRIIQAIYDLKDNISAGLRRISSGIRDHRAESDKATAAIERNNKRQAASYDSTSKAIGVLRKGLAAVGIAVGLREAKDVLVEIIETGEKFDDLGKRFEAAFGGFDAGAAALDQVKQIAAAVPQSLDDVTDAAIALKRAGIDPLDGSLQALIDNQNATNQSQQDLLATIDALGKANIKGAVSVKNLVALSQQGVPVFELLGNAMGISADRARQLAENGKLGQDSIKLLLSELGKLRAGAAAKELGDTDAQLQKLRDSAQQFLNTIAQSGALDYFREELAELNDQVAEASKSGRLKELAKSISDGIISTASAVKSSISFVVDYSGALIQLGKTYLVFRGLKIADSFLTGSAALIGSAKAAKEASKEAGAAVGVFGRLGSVVKAIPGNVLLIVAAIGIEKVINGLRETLALRREVNELEAETADGVKLNADLQERLAQRIAKTKEATAAYADVAIVAADTLRGKTDEQLAAYSRQLAGAREFYNALAVEAQNAGDQAGLAAATAKLVELEAVIANVNRQLAVTADVGTQAAAGLTEGATRIAEQLAEVATDAKAAGETMQQAFEGFDLRSNITQVGDFALALDSVAAKGGRASEVLEATLLESLRKLSGEELLLFQAAATAAMDAVGAKGSETSTTLKATLEVALQRLGVQAEDTGAKFTKAGEDTIASFRAVAENARATAGEIQAAFDAALVNVKTKEEAEALGVALQSAAQAGKIGLEALAESSRDVEARIRSITASLSPLNDEFETLGIKSQAQLVALRDNAREAFEAIVQGAREGTAAQEDVVRAFKAYADLARQSVADSTQGAREQLESQLAVRASLAGLGDLFTEVGTKGEEAGRRTARGFDGAEAAIADVADAAEAAADNLNAAADEVQGAGQQLGFFTERAGQAISEARGFDAIRTVMTRYKDEIFSTREELEEFTAAQIASANAAREAADELEALTDQLQRDRDQATLSPGELEQKRYQEQIAQIEQLAELTNNSASQTAQRARGLAEEEHRRRMAEIEAEADARRQAEEASRTPGSNNSSSGNGGGGGGYGTGGFGSANEGQPPAGSQTSRPNASPYGNVAPVLNFNIPAITSGPALEAFARQVARILEDLNRRS